MASSWRILTLARPSAQADIICRFQNKRLLKTHIRLKNLVLLFKMWEHLLALKKIRLHSLNLSMSEEKNSFCLPVSFIFKFLCVFFLENLFLKHDYVIACFWLSGGGRLLLQVTEIKYRVIKRDCRL